MTTNIERFELAVKSYADEDVPEQHRQFTQKIALQALRSLVLKTPVDTGRARANWNTTIGAPNPGDDTEVDRTGTSTIAAGEAVIRGMDPFEEVWIANGLPYIERLEQGYSGQAPKGMVATTLSELRSTYG